MSNIFNYNEWSIIEQAAFILWVIVLVILGIAFALSIVFFKKTKSKYSIGLIFLCTGFLIGRIFRIWVRFFIGEPEIGSFNYEALIAVNIVFWSIIIAIFMLAGLSILSNKLKGKLFVGFWISLIIISHFIVYISLFIIKSNIGKVPAMTPFKGTALLFENIYLIASWLGFISLFFYVENASVDLFKVEKPKFFFTAITVLALIVTVIENYTASVTSALIILFIASMAGMGSIFFYMAINSTGAVRRNSLFVCIGHFLIAFSFALDIPTGYFLFAILPSFLLLIVSPIFQIVGLFFYLGGLYPTIIKIKTK